MLFAFAYLLLRRVLQLVAGSSTDLSKDVELVVLRHQLKVLKRRVDTPRLRRRDRLFMAAMSRNLPRFRWSSFLVSPQTLLRWHGGAGAKEMDLRTALARWQTADERGAQGAGPAHGKGEPPVGVHPDQGRARQTRCPCLCDQDPYAPSNERPRPGSPAIRPDLERVP